MMDNIAEILNVAMKYCKEQEFKQLQEAMNSGYNVLILAEAEARRAKASALIRAANQIDLHIIAMEDEYELVKKKSALHEIPAIEEYIKLYRRHRDLLLRQKNQISRQ